MIPREITGKIYRNEVPTWEIKKKENMFTRMSLFIILEAIESVIDSRYRF